MIRSHLRTPQQSIFLHLERWRATIKPVSDKRILHTARETDEIKLFVLSPLCIIWAVVSLNIFFFIPLYTIKKIGRVSSVKASAES